MSNWLHLRGKVNLLLSSCQLDMTKICLNLRIRFLEDNRQWTTRSSMDSRPSMGIHPTSLGKHGCQSFSRRAFRQTRDVTHYQDQKSAEQLIGRVSNSRRSSILTAVDYHWIQQDAGIGEQQTFVLAASLCRYGDKVLSVGVNNRNHGLGIGAGDGYISLPQDSEESRGDHQEEEVTQVILASGLTSATYQDLSDSLFSLLVYIMLSSNNVTLVSLAFNFLTDSVDQLPGNCRESWLRWCKRIEQ